MVMGLLAAFVMGVGAIDLSTELGTDYGGLFSHGWFMTKGLMPYRDFWTHKTPFLPMMIAAWIALFGTGFYWAALFPLIVALAASMVVYAFATTLQLSSRIAAAAAFIFALFAATHVVDPSRNGVITIAAAAFEMLALILAMRGVRQDRWFYLAGAGISIVLAIATRQTAAVVYLPVIAAIVGLRGIRHLRTAAKDVAVMSVSVVLGVTAFVLYFVVAGVPLATAWDQIYRFNLVYAAGYRIKLTWWLSGWSQVVFQSGLAILVLGGVWLAWKLSQALMRRQTPGLAVWLLSLMAAAHFATIYVSHKIQQIYLFHLMPELCVATAIVVAMAFGYSRSPRFSSVRRWSPAAVILGLLLWPLGLEAAYWREAVARAKSGGYFFNSANLPSQIVARQIRQLAPLETDRIWVCAASADDLYPFANRLPATRYTSVARLIYVLSADDFDQWRRDLEAHEPRLIVNAYGDDWVRTSTAQPREWTGQDMTTVLNIRAYLVANFRRVNGLEPSFEAYLRREAR